MTMTAIERWQRFHDDFENALAFATRLHARQFRNGTDIPYISHLIGVAGLVLENEGGRDEAIAALLHDSVEDQGKDYPGGVTALRSVIGDRFGARVLEIVNACTDTDEDPKPPWRSRKESYIERLSEASASARLVSCADKLHNARAIVSDLRVMGDSLWGRFNGGRDGTFWYYRALSDAFIRRGPKRLAEELDRTVQVMERLGMGSTVTRPEQDQEPKAPQTFELTIAGEADVENPTESELHDAIDRMSPHGGPGFIVLEKSDGSYVQSAGGDGSYALEWRDWLDDRLETFQHFVAGRQEEPGKDVRIPTNEFNTVAVKENERLSAADVKKIMGSFLRGEGRHPAYKWRDITLNF